MESAALIAHVADVFSDIPAATASPGQVGSFSTGMEQLPNSPAKRRIGRFCDGIAQTPPSSRELPVGRFSTGMEQLPRQPGQAAGGQLRRQLRWAEAPLITRTGAPAARAARPGGLEPAPTDAGRPPRPRPSSRLERRKPQPRSRGGIAARSGGGGIRTLGAGVTHSTVFETARFNHSRTPPGVRTGRVASQRRRAAKKSSRRAAHSGCRTPPMTVGRWFRRGSARMSRTLPAAPAFGSAVP